jgi:hypothetical protein
MLRSQSSKHPACFARVRPALACRFVQQPAALTACAVLCCLCRFQDHFVRDIAYKRCAGHHLLHMHGVAADVCFGLTPLSALLAQHA